MITEVISIKGIYVFRKDGRGRIILQSLVKPPPCEGRGLSFIPLSEGKGVKMSQGRGVKKLCAIIPHKLILHYILEKS